MLLNTIKNYPTMKTLTTRTKTQYYSYQRPTFSSQMSNYSGEHCRRFKSALDIKINKTQSKKCFFDAKILPFKACKINSLHHFSKSEVYSNENNSEETVTDDENNYEDEYIEINHLNSKYDDDITKFSNKTSRIPKSNYSTATQSRNGSVVSLKKVDQSNLSNASISSGLKSNSKKLDAKKKFKNTMKRLMKPGSLTNEIATVEYETKHVRFTSLLSNDAQLSLLKTYQDMICIELSHIYPYIQTIPRTSTARFIRNLNKPRDNLSNKDDEYNNRIKTSNLFESAMKILDSIRRFKARLNQDKDTVNQFANLKLQRQSSVCTISNSIVILEEDEEDDPLEM